MLDDVQAASKNAISKTRTPVNAACLITARTYVRDISDANQPQKTAVTDRAYSLKEGRPSSETT